MFYICAQHYNQDRPADDDSSVVVEKVTDDGHQCQVSGSYSEYYGASLQTWVCGDTAAYVIHDAEEYYEQDDDDR